MPVSVSCVKHEQQRDEIKHLGGAMFVKQRPTVVTGIIVLPRDHKQRQNPLFKSLLQQGVPRARAFPKFC